MSEWTYIRTITHWLPKWLTNDSHGVKLGLLLPQCGHTGKALGFKQGIPMEAGEVVPEGREVPLA